ncbi:MAG: 2-C-methyl-D-erythritol 2,4-cyclodiphosphate synthase [Arenicellales bacterium]
MSANKNSQSKAGQFRIGQGYDVHALVEGRALIIGGVDIPFEMGLAGHSDADVLMHAICDALLGAANLGDIGAHFSPDDAKYKNKASRYFLQGAAKLISQAGYEIGNIDSTIIAEAPKMLPHITLMQENIAAALFIKIDQVSIKATTTEKLGFVGRGEGISAEAIALIYKV